MKIAKVLLVEDNYNGRTIANRLRRDGFEVCWPQNPGSLAQCISTETFDAVIADRWLNEGKWDMDRRGKRILGSVVKNGDDVGRLMRRFRAGSPVVKYTTHRETTPGTICIQKPFKPYEGELEIKLSEFRNNTLEYVRSIGPWLLRYEEFTRLTPNERVQLYKKALNLNAKWLKAALKDFGNVSWILLADKKVRLCGDSFDRDGPDMNPFNVPRAVCPGRTAITRVAKATKVFPYPFWNTTKLENLDKLFVMAGQISDYPLAHDLFNISVAHTCAAAYVEDPSLNIGKWSTRLTPEGKVQLSKSVFKRLAALGHRTYSRFVKKSEQFAVPQIVEMYEATVDKIDTKKQAVWIEFRKFGQNHICMVEPFDLTVLRKNGVKNEQQRFEYTVFRWANGSLGLNIELAQGNDRPLFSFLD